MGLRTGYVAARAKDPTVATAAASRAVPASLLVDAAATVDLPGGVALELGVQNLTGARAADPVPGDFAPITEMAQPARTFRAGVRWRLR